MASLGQALKEQREARNISLEEIAAATKIVPRYLEALEADRLGSMPKGFFIKGIIRSYAKAVGLDPDDILDRYRAAGMLDEPEHVRAAVPQRAAPREQPVQAGAGSVAAGPEPLAEETEEVPLSFEAAPRPRLSPAARRRILGVAWRAAAILGVLAILILVWSHRAPRRPEAQAANVPTQVILPPPQTTAPGTVPAAATQTGTGPARDGVDAAPAAAPPTAPASEPLATPAAAPAQDEMAKGVTIEIAFEAETWIHVQTDGQPKIDGIFPAGATATAQAERLLLLHTGNAGGFTFRLNGRPAKRLGRSGQVLTDVKITPENFRDFLEDPSEARPPA